MSGIDLEDGVRFVIASAVSVVLLVVLGPDAAIALPS